MGLVVLALVWVAMFVVGVGVGGRIGVGGGDGGDECGCGGGGAGGIVRGADSAVGGIVDLFFVACCFFLMTLLFVVCPGVDAGVAGG